MAIPNKETHGRGPAENAVVAKFSDPDILGSTTLTEDGKAYAAMMGGIRELAVHVDRLGRMFFGERWEVPK